MEGITHFTVEKVLFIFQYAYIWRNRMVGTKNTGNFFEYVLHFILSTSTSHSVIGVVPITRFILISIYATSVF